MLDNTLKVSLILAAALAASAVLRTRSAALRHWVLAAALGCALAVPALELIVPAWRVRIAPAVEQPAAADVAPIAGARLVPTAVSTRVAMARPSRSQAQPWPADDSQVSTALRWLWLAGAAGSLMMLGAGLVRLRRIGRTARPLEDTRWRTTLSRLAAEYGVTTPIRLLVGDRPTLLITWGVNRPIILVPSTAAHWSDERIQVVLGHEIAHIQRRDWLVMVVAEILRALYWFNPLVLLASRRLRCEGEQACDDAVLRHGEEGAAYASHLLEVAKAFRHRQPVWLPAPAMVRVSSLERRIGAMLNPHLERSPITRVARLATAAIVLTLTTGVAAFHAQTFTTISGSVVDGTNRPIAGAAIVLTSAATRTKHEVESDDSGRFELDGLAPSEYRLEVSAAGFAPFGETLSVGSKPVQRIVRLDIGSLMETITVYEVAAPRAWDVHAARPISYEPPPCTSGTAGGKIEQPVKLADARPIYPAHTENREVHVQLEGRVGTDGFFEEVRVVSPSQGDFDVAAVDAVRKWQFSQTRLNCVPVEVPIDIHVNFVPTP